MLITSGVKGLTLIMISLEVVKYYSNLNSSPI